MNPTQYSPIYCTVFVQEHGDCEDFLPLYEGTPRIKQHDLLEHVIRYNTDSFHSLTCFNNFDESAEKPEDRNLRIVSAVFLYQHKDAKFTQYAHEVYLQQLGALYAAFSFSAEGFDNKDTAQKALDDKINQELLALLKRQKKTTPKHTGNFIDCKA